MKIDTVTITIRLGNERAQEEDVPSILLKLAARIEARSLDYITKVLDENGNTIGEVVCS